MAGMPVAVLGTGIMGEAMARRMLAAGLEVRVWNRTLSKAEPLGEAGATVASTAGEAVAGAGIVATMLADESATLDVMEAEALPAMESGAVWLQMGTIGLDGTRRAADVAAKHGVELVDAPVLGTRQPAEQGQLLILASGDDRAIDRCQVVFEAVGRQALRLGPAGTGSRMKLVVNGWLLGLLGNLAESLALAEALGIGGDRFLEAIEGGPLSPPYAGMLGAKMLGRNYPASFPLELAAKDARLVEEAAREAGLQPAVVPAVGGLLRRAVEAGFGDQDMSAVYEAARLD
jgi:3-hydroxyisobutyrate dehydrogenase